MINGMEGDVAWLVVWMGEGSEGMMMTVGSVEAMVVDRVDAIDEVDDI
jgi:hypothetical protein